MLHRIGAVWGGLVLFVVAGAPAAFGATTSVSSGQLSFTAASGEANQVLVEQGATSFRVIDTGGSITPGAGCTATNANQVSCASAGVTKMLIRTYD